MAQPKIDETIRGLRAALHLTQTHLAAKIGASDSSVAHYETGARRPDPFTLARIVAVAVRAQQWGIATELANLLPGVAEGLLKPTWGDIVHVRVETTKE